LDKDSLTRKNDELAQAYKEKSRKLLQTQELYDKLKRKAMLGQIQDAATDAADSQVLGVDPAGVNVVHPSQPRVMYPSRADIPFRAVPVHSLAEQAASASGLTRAYGTTRAESGWGDRSAIANGTLLARRTCPFFTS